MSDGKNELDYICQFMEWFLLLPPQNQNEMNAEATNSTMKDWILFAVSTILMIWMLFAMPQWFWLVLPFSCTYLVKALRVM